MKSTITCDMEGVILTANDGAVSMFGYSRDELIGKIRVSVFSPGEIVLQNLSHWLSKAVEDGEYVTETVFIRKSGEKFSARIRLSGTFKDGKQIGFCGVTEELEEDIEVPIKSTTHIIKWLVITRAPFLTAALTPLVLGLAFTSGYLGFSVNWLHAILACIGVALLHVASNVFNDYFDVKSGTDQANTKYFVQYSGGSRAVEMRLISLAGTLRLAVIFSLVAFAIGLFLTWQIGIGVLWVGLAGLAAGFFYTSPPVRLVARRGLGEVTIGLAFGPLITLGMHYVVTAAWSWDAFLIGIPAGLLTTNILLINQVPDMEGDAVTGKNHLVVTFGPVIAIWIYAFILAAAIALTVAYAFIFALPLLLGVAAFMIVHGAWIVSWARKHLFDRSLVKANVQTINLQIIATVLFTLVLALS